MNRFGKLMFVALVGIFLFVPSRSVGQDKFFNVAVFNEEGSIDTPRFALNPDNGTLILTYSVKRTGKPPMIAVNAAKIKESGNPRFGKTRFISDQNLGSAIPSIVYHPKLNQFLVMWHSFSADGSDDYLSLGGRLLNKKGNPANFSIGIGLGNEFDLAFPIPNAYTGDESLAPAGASFFIVFVRRLSETKVFGQWFDRNLRHVGESLELIQFDNISLALYDSHIINGNTGIFALEENYIDDASGENRYTLSVLRFFLDDSKASSRVILKKDDMNGWGHVDLFAASGKQVILGTIPASKPTENYQIRNAGKLRASKKSKTVSSGEPANSQNIVQLDDGRIFQVILTDIGEIVVQQLSAKGKPLGAPVARIVPPFDARFSTSQAVAMPGRDDILIVLCDNSSPELSVKGSLVMIN